MAKQRIETLPVVCPVCKTGNPVKMDMNAPDVEMLKENSMVICKKCDHRFLVEGNIHPDRPKI